MRTPFLVPLVAAALFASCQGGGSSAADASATPNIAGGSSSGSNGSTSQPSTGSSSSSATGSGSSASATGGSGSSASGSTGTASGSTGTASCSTGMSGSSTGSSGTGSSGTGTSGSPVSSGMSGSSCSSGSTGTSGSSGTGSSTGTSGTSGSCTGSSGSGSSSSSGTSCNQSLPNVTTDCFVIVGCGLDEVTGVTFDGTALDANGAFGDGSYTIVDEHRLEVCPPLCMDAGTYVIEYSDANGVLGSQEVDITVPDDPTLVCEADHLAGTEQCVFLSSGTTPNTAQFLIYSTENIPTVVPGLLSLDIGNQGTNYSCGPGAVDACFKRVVGLIPASAIGQTLYFQSILIDPVTFSTPYLTSNVCATTYQ
ncbi:MAG: hypothetical protein KAI24_21645 [Planctomycetes bacterium]|nr:hypothetical protein [Planctomycetota bacterium]